MKFLLAALLVAHGLIHMIGATRPWGAAWVLAGALFVLAGLMLFLSPRWWWAPAACAIPVSLVMITTVWSEAKYGALADILALAAVTVGFAMSGPTSFRAEYERDVALALAGPRSGSVVTDADLAPLPQPVQRYLRLVGVIGHPRVANVRVRMHGRIRSGPTASWMPLEAEQHNVFGAPARLFYMDATLAGVPFGGYHRFAGGAATMKVKVAGLFPVLDASGPEMTQAETVTLFNDMCLLAPASLIDPAIQWKTLDDHHVRARFAHAGHTVEATLVFNGAGQLVNFWSDDRRRVGRDGRTMVAVRWSTPIDRYQTFGPFQLMAHGEARWHEEKGEYPYIELWVRDITYNVEAR